MSLLEFGCSSSPTAFQSPSSVLPGIYEYKTHASEGSSSEAEDGEKEMFPETLNSQQSTIDMKIQSLTALRIKCMMS